MRAEISRFWQQKLEDRAVESDPLIQILMGPRQVGKTTSLGQLVAKWPKDRSVFESADDRQLEGSFWIEQTWIRARKIRDQQNQPVLLVLDEIQKISGWSETIKKLWDEDVRGRSKMHVILSGSSALSIQKGLTESLAGRFELIPATHLTYGEYVELCNGSLEEYIYFGGYPGALRFQADESRWRQYVLSSIIESIVSRDILMLTRIDKPSLLRRLLQLGCEFSGQILSFQKAMGQLQDAGNTTTLAHYLNLLGQAFLLSGLQKFEGDRHRKRASSPKFQVHNNALMSASKNIPFAEAQTNPEIWGRFVESSVGSHLVNLSRIQNFEVQYWREGDFEVDFIVKLGEKMIAIEVKSNSRTRKLSGLKEFTRRYSKTVCRVLSENDLESFFKLKSILDL